MAATSLLYYRIEAYQEVEELLRNSLPAMQAVHGPEALCVAGILSLLALVHARVGNVVNGVQADPGKYDLKLSALLCTLQIAL